MKTLATGSLFVLLAIAAGISAAPSAFADHPTAEVQFAVGSINPACADTDECFIPSEVTVDVGGEVIWTNVDNVFHTIAAGDLSEDPRMIGTDYPNGFGDAGTLIQPGETFTHKFEVEGTYPYVCTVHPWMVGVVIVEGMDEHMDDVPPDMDGMKDKDEHMDGMKDKDEHMDGMKDKDEHMDGMKDKDEHMMKDVMMPSSLDQIMATITPDVTATKGSPMSIEVAITDMEGNALEHVNFKVTAMQGDQTIYQSELEHEHEGVGTVMTAPLQVDPADMPVDITVEFLGFGVDEITGPSGELATAQVVPEFGTIAMMILGIAIISIIAVTAKSRVIPRI